MARLNGTFTDEPYKKPENPRFGRKALDKINPNRAYEIRIELGPRNERGKYPVYADKVFAVIGHLICKSEISNEETDGVYLGDRYMNDTRCPELIGYAMNGATTFYRGERPGPTTVYIMGRDLYEAYTLLQDAGYRF